MASKKKMTLISQDGSSQEIEVNKSRLKGYKAPTVEPKEKQSLKTTISESAKSAAKTLGNVATNMGKSAIKSVEGTSDTLSNLSNKINTGIESLVLKGMGNSKEDIKKYVDEQNEGTRNYIKKDLTNSLLDKTGWNDYQSKWEDGSLVKESNLGGQISQGVGGMVPSLVAGQAIGGLGATTETLSGLKGANLAKTAAKNVAKGVLNNAGANLALGSSSYGSGLEEAYNNGANDKQANLYALGSAATEFGTEMLTGGIPGLESSTGVFDNLVEKGISKATNGITNKTLQSVAKSGLKIGSNMLGEGLEEGMSEVINPYLKNATYSSGEKVNWKDVGQSALVGGLTGAFLSGPTDVINTIDEIQANKVKQVQQQVQKGEITPQQGSAAIEEIKNNTYEENNQLRETAKQELENVKEKLNNGMITQEQAIKEIETLTNNVRQQQEKINQPKEVQNGTNTSDNSNINSNNERNKINLNENEQQEYNKLKELNDLPFDDGMSDIQKKRYQELELKKNNSKVYQDIENRTLENIKSGKAIQYDNPEVKPFYQDTAKGMLKDLNNTQKGERFMKEDGTFSGQKRFTTNEIEQLKDQSGMQYKDIERGLNGIIEDNGKENNIQSKKVELVIDQMLKNGYTDINGEKTSANQDYIDVLNGKTNDVSMNENKYDDPELELDTTGKEVFKDDVVRVLDKKEITNRKKLEAKENNRLSNRINDVKSKINDFRRAFVDKSEVIDRLQKAMKKNGQKSELRATYNQMGMSDGVAQYNIGKAQTNISGDHYNNFIDKNGNETSMSWNEIYEDANSNGIDDNLLDNYLMLWRNIDEINKQEGHRIFDLDLNNTKEEISNIEKENPEIKRIASNVWKYYENMRQNQVDFGLIDNDMKNLLEEQSPHYVRIQRDVNNTNQPMVNYGGVSIKNGIQGMKTTGLNIMPLKDVGAQYTMSMEKAMYMNKFANELGKTLNYSNEEIGNAVIDGMNSIDENTLEPIEVLKNGDKYTITYYKDGVKTTSDIDSDLYEAMQSNKKYKFEDNVLFNTMNKLSKIQRTLLTDKNPLFMITNAVKDFQDALINTKYSGAEFAKNWTKAYKEMTTNGKLWQQYQALGGLQNTYFENGEVINKKASALNPIEWIEKANGIIEQAPRFAEFMTSLEHGTSLTEAMFNSAEVTTNFNRGGDVTKMLNRNGWTFLNASVQGFDKMIRNITEIENPKQIASLLAKASLYGIIPSLFNMMTHDDDEEYEDLPDYIKDNYYVLNKDKNGNFIRIPKGRVLSILGSAARYTKEVTSGKEKTGEAFTKWFNNAKNQVGPNSTEDNVFSPLKAVAENKSWNGSKIVNSSLEKKPENEQYDSKTDRFSIWLANTDVGKKMKLSPKKINYVLDQYTGVIGDFVLPSTSEYAETEYDNSIQNTVASSLKNKFSADPVMNNKNVSEFYDTLTNLEKNNNATNSTDEDKAKYSYIYSTSMKISELSKEQKEIESNKNISNKEKYNQARDIQKEIISEMKKTMDDIENINKENGMIKIGDTYYDKDKNGSLKKVSQDKIDKANELNIDLKTYNDATSKISDMHDKKDSNGKVIKTRKEQVKEYIESLNLTAEEKKSLYNKYYK